MRCNHFLINLNFLSVVEAGKSSVGAVEFAWRAISLTSVKNISSQVGILISYLAVDILVTIMWVREVSPGTGALSHRGARVASFDGRWLWSGATVHSWGLQKLRSKFWMENLKFEVSYAPLGFEHTYLPKVLLLHLLLPGCIVACPRRSSRRKDTVVGWELHSNTPGI